MRSRIIAAVLLAAIAVTGLGAALASPGTAEDPLVTLNYLNQTFYPELEQAMLEQAQKGTAGIEQEALERLTVLSSDYLGKANQDGLLDDTFLRLTLARDDVLILSSGSGLQFEAGVTALSFSSGCLIDVTTGTVADGTRALTPGHRYIAAEETACTVTVLSDAAYLSACGSYDLIRTGKTYTPFVDIVAPIWYSEPVLYAYQEGLVNGMTPTTYEPMTQMNRAMLVTLLSRMAGVQGTVADAGFTDVPAGEWYTDAVNWAYSTGIVMGMGDGTFAPTATLTREQMAVILYRYATDYLGKDAVCDGDLTRFPDADKTSDWAVDALSWAVGTGLINGKGDLLAPKDYTNRAEVATILYRFNTLLPD